MAKQAVLRVVLIGCGRISRRHLDVIRECPELHLVGVCDVVGARARAAAELAGSSPKVFSDYREMVESLHPDIAVVLTESGSHAAIGKSLSGRVAVLIVEKPMALTLQSADELVEACEHAGTRLFVVKQNRYNPPVARAREALVNGRFGKLVLGTVRVRWCRTQEYYAQDAWRGTWAQDGGVFTNQASHHIDLLQWFFGPVESVHARIATQLVDIETEDTGVATLKFMNGALGVIEATTATRPKDLEGSLSVLGERGAVVIAGFAVNRVETWQFSETEPGDSEIQSLTTAPPNVYGFGHYAFYRDVLKSIVENKRSMLDGLEGRKSLELINALYESAETGREVRLRYVPRHVRLGTSGGHS
jgi:predicted dehydrogenase